MVFEHHSEHTPWIGGRWIALLLIVGCAGCAVSHDQRCGDRCGTPTQPCGSQYTASCSDGTCASGVWRAGYRCTTWRPLVAECDRVDSPFIVPSAPMPMSDEEIRMPEPAVVPFQGHLPDDGVRSAGVDWEPLLPQTMPVRQAAGSPFMPKAMPHPPAIVHPGLQPSIPPTTVEVTDDPFEAEFHPDSREAASAPAFSVPLAWVPTERTELQFKEMSSAP
jgi:hypothetical protein